MGNGEGREWQHGLFGYAAVERFEWELGLLADVRAIGRGRDIPIFAFDSLGFRNEGRTHCIVFRASPARRSPILALLIWRAHTRPGAG